MEFWRHRLSYKEMADVFLSEIGLKTTFMQLAFVDLLWDIKNGTFKKSKLFNY
jgi:hypothetical protein